jgi:hypothetical protein
MIEEFLNRGDARKASISQNELDRRWKAVRARMAEKGVDYLLVQSQQRYVGGYFRWFTDIPGANYPVTGIFPLKGEGMTIIYHGPGVPAPAIHPPDWALRGVIAKINTPAFPNVWWEDAWDAERAVEVMKRTKPKTVGFVGMGNMSVAFADNVRKGLAGVNFINATDLVDEVRMVKSEEELNLHREAAYMHEMTYEVAKAAKSSRFRSSSARRGRCTGPSTVGATRTSDGRLRRATSATCSWSRAWREGTGTIFGDTSASAPCPRRIRRPMRSSWKRGPSWLRNQNPASCRRSPWMRVTNS